MKDRLAAGFPARFVTFTLLLMAGSALAQAPTRALEEIADGLYRVQNNNHYAMLLVTDEGALVADPINADFSLWLRNEVEERFGVPVRYVVYSHHHWDHASGGHVFEDTAQFVGHENMLGNLAMPSADTPLPGNMAAMDGNGNGAIERSEATGVVAERFHLYDADANNAINGAEGTRGAINEVRAPDLTYRDRLTISLGGKDVELIHTGTMTHTDDMSIIRFPEERTIFVVDWISPRRVPFGTLGSGMLDSWLNAIRFAEALDYDHAAGGHGVIGNKADITAVRHYLEELRVQVAAGIAAGQTLEEMQASILMEPYQSWINYEQWRPLNVEGMYNMLTQ